MSALQSGAQVMLDSQSVTVALLGDGPTMAFPAALVHAVALSSATVTATAVLPLDTCTACSVEARLAGLQAGIDVSSTIAASVKLHVLSPAVTAVRPTVDVVCRVVPRLGTGAVTLTLELGNSSVAAPCGAVDATGACSAALDVPAAWFASGLNETATMACSSVRGSDVQDVMLVAPTPAVAVAVFVPRSPIEQSEYSLRLHTTLSSVLVRLAVDGNATIASVDALDSAWTLTTSVTSGLVVILAECADTCESSVFASVRVAVASGEFSVEGVVLQAFDSAGPVAAVLGPLAVYDEFGSAATGALAITARTAATAFVELSQSTVLAGPAGGASTVTVALAAYDARGTPVTGTLSCVSSVPGLVTLNAACTEALVDPSGAAQSATTTVLSFSVGSTTVSASLLVLVPSILQVVADYSVVSLSVVEYISMFVVPVYVFLRHWT